MSLKIGADPELFVRRGLDFISGHVFECGTKANPMRTPNGAVQVDGLALEFNIPPAETEYEFLKNVNLARHDLDIVVRRRDPTCKVEATPVVFFGREYLKSLPEEISALGCSPDFNAYTGDINPRPDAEVAFRTGAGHIHLGWTEGEDERGVSHYDKCCQLARQLDFYVGLSSLKWDPDHTRRSLYGRAGAFRPKPYGMEYRVPSNVWLNHEDLIRKVFRLSSRAYHQLEKGEDMYERYGMFAHDAINSNENWTVAAPWALFMEVIDAASL